MVSMKRGLLGFALGLAACTTPIETQDLALRSTGPLVKFALVQLQVADRVRGAQPERDKNRPSQLVTARLLGAFDRHRTFELVSSAEVVTALGRDVASSPADRVRACGRLSQTFGVQGILFGTVERFQQRVGGERGVTRPAAVRFRLELRSRTGEVIWRGIYDEAQQSLAADPRSLQRVRERDFRWVTAEELARYGARELVLALPGGPETFK